MNKLQKTIFGATFFTLVHTTPLKADLCPCCHNDHPKYELCFAKWKLFFNSFFCYVENPMNFSLGFHFLDFVNQNNFDVNSIQSLIYTLRNYPNLKQDDVEAMCGILQEKICKNHINSRDPNALKVLNELIPHFQFLTQEFAKNRKSIDDFHLHYLMITGFIYSFLVQGETCFKEFLLAYKNFKHYGEFLHVQFIFLPDYLSHIMGFSNPEVRVRLLEMIQFLRNQYNSNPDVDFQDEPAYQVLLEFFLQQVQELDEGAITSFMKKSRTILTEKSDIKIIAERMAQATQPQFFSKIFLKMPREYLSTMLSIFEEIKTAKKDLENKKRMIEDVDQFIKEALESMGDYLVLPDCEDVFEDVCPFIKGFIQKKVTIYENENQILSYDPTDTYIITSEKGTQLFLSSPNKEEEALSFIKKVFKKCYIKKALDLFKREIKTSTVGDFVSFIKSLQFLNEYKFQEQSCDIFQTVIYVWLLDSTPDRESRELKFKLISKILQNDQDPVYVKQVLSLIIQDQNYCKNSEFHAIKIFSNELLDNHFVKRFRKEGDVVYDLISLYINHFDEQGNPGLFYEKPVDINKQRVKLIQSLIPTFELITQERPYLYKVMADTFLINDCAMHNLLYCILIPLLQTT